MIPQIEYLTNDSWENITAYEGSAGWPLFHQAAYGSGNLFVLTIPDNFSDLYNYPAPVLNMLRKFVSQDMPVQLEGPSQVCLFAYNNGTFIVESFLPETVKVKVVVKKATKAITDLTSKEIITGFSRKEPKMWRMPTGDITTFEVTIPAHSFRGFKIND
jgi:hypothetical protein